MKHSTRQTKEDGVAATLRRFAGRVLAFWKRLPPKTKVVLAVVLVVSVLSVISSSHAMREISDMRREIMAAQSSGERTAGTKHPAKTRNHDKSQGDAGDTDDQARQAQTQPESEPQSDPESLWHDPTGGSQPDLTTLPDLSVLVDLASQKVHVRSAGTDVYVMTASSGLDDSTPRGDFIVDGRGEHFYNPDEGMGADYWVNFLDNTYLFHSVPTTETQGEYLPEEGAKLGQPASHGCVRLSIADARWLYEQLPDGTPVHIG